MFEILQIRYLSRTARVFQSSISINFVREIVPVTLSIVKFNVIFVIIDVQNDNDIE